MRPAWRINVLYWSCSDEFSLRRSVRRSTASTESHFIFHSSTTCLTRWSAGSSTRILRCWSKSACDLGGWLWSISVCISTSNQNWVPLPGWLVTLISPPISAMSCLEIANPNPVPPNFLVVEPSSWVNARKIWSSLLLLIPMPVSFTSKRIRLLPDWVLTNLSDKWISPLCVNLMALLIRLERIWRSLTLSASTVRFKFWGIL